MACSVLVGRGWMWRVVCPLLAGRAVSRHALIILLACQLGVALAMFAEGDRKMFGFWLCVAGSTACLIFIPGAQ